MLNLKFADLQPTKTPGCHLCFNRFTFPYVSQALVAPTPAVIGVFLHILSALDRASLIRQFPSAAWVLSCVETLVFTLPPLISESSTPR